MEKKYELNEHKVDLVCEPMVASNSLDMKRELAIKRIRHIGNDNLMQAVLDFISQKEQDYLRDKLKEETNELASLPNNWDGEGAYRMFPASITNVLNILDDDRARLELVSDIYPNRNGFVSIQWDGDNDEMVGLEMGRTAMSFFVTRKTGSQYYNGLEINSENLNILFSSLALL